MVAASSDDDLARRWWMLFPGRRGRRWLAGISHSRAAFG
jgi:hypothetical protein